jgi:hypothetical protein
MAHYNQLKNGIPLYDANGNVFGFEHDLTWNDKWEHFQLTLDSVKNEVGLNLEEVKGDHENANIFLNELARIVYGYLYKKKTAGLNEKLRYYLKYEKRARKIIWQSMIDMIKYAMVGGGNIVGYQPAVNPNESTILDIREMRDERIVSFVMDSLLKSGKLIDRGFIEEFTVPNEEW